MRTIFDSPVYNEESNGQTTNPFDKLVPDVDNSGTPVKTEKEILSDVYTDGGILTGGGTSINDLNGWNINPPPPDPFDVSNNPTPVDTPPVGTPTVGTPPVKTPTSIDEELFPDIRLTGSNDDIIDKTKPKEEESKPTTILNRTNSDTLMWVVSTSLIIFGGYLIFKK